MDTKRYLIVNADDFGQSAGINLGQIGAGTSGGIASLLQASGQAGSAGILTDAQAGAAAKQQALNTAATAAQIFFSDPNLKENIEEIGQVGPLKLMQWDWLEKTKGTMIDKCMTIGFMADEVKEIFPQFVHEFCGLMVVDYPNLLNELEAV